MEYGPFTHPSAYRPEAAHLRSENLADSASIKPAEMQTKYSELARTEAAQYVQGYIHAGNEAGWEALTRYQRQDRLTPATYNELVDLSREAMPDVASYRAVDLANVIHDDFKNPDLTPQVGLPRGANHDNALRRLFLPEYQAVRQEHFPSLESGEFSADQLALIEGLLQGDFIRFVQSQASEAEVDKLAKMPRRILLATIMHGIHDLGGAMGHKQPATSLTLDEPATTRLLDATHSLLMTHEELGVPADFPLDGFARGFLYRHLRAARLGISDTPTDPDLELPSKLAVADLLRCYTAEDFAVPQAAFERLPKALRLPWTYLQGLPLYYPHSYESSPNLGTEYTPAFLRSFGKDEEALRLGLGCFAQVQIHARGIPFNISDGLDAVPAEFPYDKINFYHLANTLKENPPSVNEPVWIEYTIENELLTPRVVPKGHRGTYVRQLYHPDIFITEEP